MEQKNVTPGRKDLNKKWAALSKKNRESLAECRRLIDLVKNYPISGTEQKKAVLKAHLELTRRGELLAAHRIITMFSWYTSSIVLPSKRPNYRKKDNFDDIACAELLSAGVKPFRVDPNMLHFSVSRGA